MLRSKKSVQAQLGRIRCTKGKGKICSEILPADDLGFNQVGGAALAQGDPSGNHDRVPSLDQPFLQSHLGGQREDAVGGVDLSGEEGDDTPEIGRAHV